MFKPNFFKNNKGFYVKWDDQLATVKIANELISHLPENQTQPIVFFCIGTDRSTGDSLGPLVGSQLIDKRLPANFYVHGTLADPIHAVNLQEKLLEMKRLYENPFIVGIDACLGQTSHVGTIQVKDGPLKPGAGVNKTLPPVGDIHLTGIVNISGFMEFLVLQNTRLFLVMNIAKSISDSIYKAGLLYTHKFNQVHSLLGEEKDSIS